MAELVSDFKVERYNKHYFPETYDFVEEKGNPVLPDLTYLNNETWTYECVVTPKEGDYYSKGYEKLFDLNATAWATFNHYDFLKYEITVDMQETKRVNGFAIEQVASDIATSPRKRAFMARKVQVQFSVDGSVWTEAIDYTLGTTLGEIDLLSIAAPTNARYLKFVLTDITETYIQFHYKKSEFSNWDTLKRDCLISSIQFFVIGDKAFFLIIRLKAFVLSGLLSYGQ